MDKLEPRLQQLVAEACKHPAGSAERQKSLTQIIRLISSRLWKEHTPDYEDALQQTWFYFCKNICQSSTGQGYDPERSSVVTWLNSYLKWRLQDLRIDDKPHTELKYDLHANPDIPPILEEVRSWAEEDADGELRRIHMEGRPDVNCQVLILRRLPPETTWKQLAAEFNLSIAALSSFYRRQCVSRLHNFGKSEGYI